MTMAVFCPCLYERSFRFAKPNFSYDLALCTICLTVSIYTKETKVKLKNCQQITCLQNSLRLSGKKKLSVHKHILSVPSKVRDRWVRIKFAEKVLLLWEILLSCD